MCLSIGAPVFNGIPAAMHVERADAFRALLSSLVALFLKYCDLGTIAVRALCVTVAPLSPSLGNYNPGRADPWAPRTHRLSL